MSDTNLLLTITVLVFFALYLSAVVFLGGGFTKPQNFLKGNDHAHLHIGRDVLAQLIGGT